MRTLPQIVETILRTPASGVVTDENKLDPDFIEDLVHQYRAQAIWEYWNDNESPNRINSVWGQTFYPKFEENLQEDDCFVRFRCPSVIGLDNTRDGFLYIGAMNGTNNFRHAATRAELSTLQNHRVTKPSFEHPIAIWSDGFLDIYGNPELQEIQVEGIFRTPTEIPTYNKDFDEYPASDEILVLTENLIFQAHINEISETELDTISDSQDTPEINRR